MMSEAPAVVTTNLDFAYDDAMVLEDVNVTIEPRDLVGIVGPNGGGKTTLLKLILGLLEPTSGTVRVFGQRPAGTSQRIGYVPQSFQYDPQFPTTVMDVVLMGRLGKGNLMRPYRASDRDSAAQALAQVGLQGLHSRPFAELSGGQRQRSLIARALTSWPDILMLDEPTASVDALMERELYDLLRELNETMTIILVTHDLGFVSEVVKGVLCVNRRVIHHPTADLDDVTGDLLRQMYGSDMRVVRHDQHCQEGS